MSALRLTIEIVGWIMLAQWVLMGAIRASGYYVIWWTKEQGLWRDLVRFRLKRRKQRGEIS